MEVIESAFLGRLPEVARELNRGFLLSGYNSLVEPAVCLKSVSSPRKFMFGNEAVAK